MWTPNHNHKGTHQLIISLGGTRTLNVAKKGFKMKNRLLRPALVAVSKKTEKSEEKSEEKAKK